MKKPAKLANVLFACIGILALQVARATETPPTRNPSHAVHQNPELAAHENQGDDATAKSKALAITKLDLDVRI